MEREKEKYSYMYKESEKDRLIERLRERFNFLIFIDFIASSTLINVIFNSILIIFMYVFIYLSGCRHNGYYETVRSDS